MTNRYNINSLDRIRDFYLINSEKDARKILDAYNHMEENNVEYDEFLYDHVKDFLCKDYNIKNTKHLDYLAHTFGYDIVRYIDSSSIINLIELDDEQSEKVQNLIEALEDIDDVQNVYSNLG